MSVTTEEKSALEGVGLASVAGPAWFAASVFGAILVFWYGFVSLVDAWSIPEYSHGPIIPLLSTFLFLREMRLAPPTEGPVTDRWPGVLVVLAALFVGVLGNVVRIADITTYGFILWVAGMVLVCFGLRRGAVFWPAVLHLVFMLPLPQFVYWQLSIFLQMVSSEIGVWMVAAAGIPVFLDGNIIDLGVYKLQVAEACSGLRYLFPLLSFSYVFAVLYTGPRWHKVVLLLSAAPITVLMNSFRIGIIGILVDSYGIEHAEGFLHTFEGWIIFVACVALLFLLTMVMQWIVGDRRSLSEALNLEFDGLKEQALRVRDIRANRALIVAASVTCAVAAAWSFAPERATVTVEREPLVVFPRSMAGWSGASGLLEPNIEAVLGADDYFTGNFFHPEEAAAVDLFMAYYRKQTEGAGIHSPEVCIPTSGWEVSRWQLKTVTLESGEELTVNRAVIQKGTARQLVYFWFEQRGRRMTNDYVVKLMAVFDSLLRGRTDGGLVRVITPMAPNEAEAVADARLVRFLSEVEPHLPRFLPK